MNLSPVTRFCSDSQEEGKKRNRNHLQEIGQSVHNTIVRTLETFEKYQVQIQSLSLVDTIEDNNVLRWFQMSLKMKQSQLVRALGETVPRVRAGELSEDELMDYLRDDWLFPFTNEKCENFLNERQEEVDIKINITLNS